MKVQKSNAGSSAVGFRMKQFREEKEYTIQRMAITACTDLKHLKKLRMVFRNLLY